MISLSEIRLLGDPVLYQKCDPVQSGEINEILPHIDKMAFLVKLFREKYGKGRGIAAPQIGLLKRLIVLNIDEPIVIINPILEWMDNEVFELWDDCMSFPNLLVKVQRHVRCKITYRDLDWNLQTWSLHGDMSELIQHEYDHLEGILCTQRAIDNTSFRYLPSQSE